MATTRGRSRSPVRQDSDEKQERVRSPTRAAFDTATVVALVQERENARKAKDWTRADSLREQIRALGVTLHDKENVWRSSTGEVGIIPQWSSDRQPAPNMTGEYLQTSTIKMLVDAREVARKKKDWQQADKIRDDLKARGVSLFDKEGLWKASDGRVDAIMGAGRGGMASNGTGTFPQYMTPQAYNGMANSMMENPYMMAYGANAMGFPGAMAMQNMGYANAMGGMGAAMGAMGAMGGMNAMGNMNGSSAAFANPATATENDIKTLVLEREQARSRSDFRMADALRNRLTAMGVTLQDKQKSWSRASDGLTGVIPMYSSFLGQ